MRECNCGTFNKRIVVTGSPTTYVQVVVVAGTIWGHGLVFAAAEVEAAAEATAAAVAARDQSADDEHRLARGRGDHKVRVDILLSKLLRNVQAQGSVVVVDVTLRLVAEDGVGTVHLLELELDDAVRVN